MEAPSPNATEAESQHGEDAPSMEIEQTTVPAQKKRKEKRKKVKETPSSEKENQPPGLTDGGPSKLVFDVAPEAPPLDNSSPEHRLQRQNKHRVEEDPRVRLVVKIGDMSPLTANPDIVHPLVRFCVVDASTGEALETITSEDGIVRPRYHMTLPFDLRQRSSTQPIWQHEAELLVPENIEQYPQAMLLLEVLDFGKENISGTVDKQGGIFPIAWGFLYLRNRDGDSNAKRNLRVQMFRSPERRGPFGGAFLWISNFFAQTPQSAVEVVARSSNTLSAVPELFAVFRDPTNRNDTYAATIGTSFFFVSPGQDYELKSVDATPYEEYLLRVFEAAMFQRAVDRKLVPPRSSIAPARVSRAAKSDEERRARHNDLVTSNFIRATGERCLPPNSVLHTLPLEGSVTALTFSPNSTLLAVAVTSDFHGSIRLYECQNPRPLIAVLRGHVGRIHDVRFNASGKHLVSASADRTVRVWHIEALSLFVTSGDEDRKTCLHTLVHPMQVYSASFLEQKYVVTAGLDFNLRIWSWSSGQLLGLARMSTSVTPSFFRQLVSFGNDGERLWALDGLGHFSIWRVSEDVTTKEFVALKNAMQPTRIPGATRVSLVGGSIAAFMCPDRVVPSVLLLDTSSNKTLRRITVPHDRRSELATCLLPDAKLVAVALDCSTLQLYDVGSGDLMTPDSGLDVLQSFAPADVSHISWNSHAHLSAIASDPGEGRGATVTILGRPRAHREEIFEHDRAATDLVRAICGGKQEIKRAGAGAQFLNHDDAPRSLKPQTRRGRSPERQEREMRPVDDPGFRYEQGNARATIDRILSFWEGLKGKAKPDESPA